MVVDKYEQYFKDHNRTKEFSGHSAKVHTVAWSCDGKRLASGSLDKTACVFTLDKDRLVKGRSLLIFSEKETKNQRLHTRGTVTQSTS